MNTKREAFGLKGFNEICVCTESSIVNFAVKNWYHIAFEIIAICGVSRTKHFLPIRSAFLQILRRAWIFNVYWKQPGKMCLFYCKVHFFTRPEESLCKFYWLELFFISGKFQLSWIINRIIYGFVNFSCFSSAISVLGINFHPFFPASLIVYITRMRIFPSYRLLVTTLIVIN